MTRNLKIGGIALLLAVFAISAIAAVGASAEEEEGGNIGTLTAAQYPAKLDGTDTAVGPNAFIFFGEEIKCPDSSFTGDVAKASSTFTITPTYNNCTSGGGGHKVTITMNGCDYLFHIEKTTTTIKDNYFTSVDLLCPAGKEVEVHLYVNAATEGIVLCNISVEEQKGIKRAKLTVDTTKNDFTLETAFSNISASKSGLCGGAETKEGKYQVNVTFTGTNNAGGANNLGISD